MRRLLLLAIAAVSSAAHAETVRCTHSLLHTTVCKTAPRPTPAASVGAESASAPTPESASASPGPSPQQHAPSQLTADIAPPPPIVASIVDPRSVEPYACNFAEKITLGAQVCQARQIAQSHRIIGGLVHQGRCDEAVRAARTTGDEAYAERMREFCVDRAH
jgi:hypothetical protein